MRAGLSSWSAFLATMDLATELERVFAVEVFSDDDLDAMKTPLDLVQFFRGRSGDAASSKDIESEALAWLSRVRGTTATPMDLQLDFTQLFSVERHP